jgi:hypothetical protein
VPDPASVRPVRDAVKAALAEAQQQRTDYLNKRAEMLKALQGADADGREQIRTQLTEAREAFLAQQRENRKELRKTIQDLKDKLADHSDAVEGAKEHAKNTAKGHAREGGE